ncbi:MAG: outer membrane protein assembly factor BamA [Gammaproteobacteria bacterium]|nr:MAG: outer membrane protein assembly factor BamA [Gammaproteobacteria bacterium]RLA15252.1 MAG: outer membrane protein assembly factor BamA [Gammaproteobacteria bacterium]
MPASFAEEFVIDDIRVEGLRRISAGTVFNALPVAVGDRVDDASSGRIIRALFSTEFFRDVSVDRRGGVLIITVDERPSIAELNIEGNEDIPTEDLEKGLADIGLAVGRVYVPSALDAVAQELERQYYSHGKYGVELTTDVVPLSRNRVNININIIEGKVARIRDINIVGNHQFDDADLLTKFELTPPNLISFVTNDDRYSKEKLSGDLENLTSFYLDNGYLDFEIMSTQVAITPNKDEMYITVNVVEGKQYLIEEVQLSGDLIVDPQSLVDLVEVRPGDVFSRSKVTETSDVISEALGAEGYAFANVNPIPDVDEENSLVSLTFFIDPGKRAYVRRISFAGNTKTQDQVLRREMRQMEGAWFSNEAVERSRVRLERLGFFEEVTVETPAVEGSPDQLDVNFAVSERSSGSISAGFGIGQGSGIMLNASIVQENFLGTGRRLAFTVATSDISDVYSISQTNPYWTKDGVSQTLSLYSRSTDAAEENLAEYDTSTIGFNVGFGIPISEFNTIGLSGGIEFIDMGTNDFTPPEIREFVRKNGDSYTQLKMGVSWSNDTRNRAIFADRGGMQSLSAEIATPLGDLEFYKLYYNRQQYWPVGKRGAFLLQGSAGYGDGYGDTDDLPFYENFFAGGVSSVRGFKANTLGPQTTQTFSSEGDPFGGSKLIVGKGELFFPIPFLKEPPKSMRLSLFVDAGNVFGPDEDIEIDELRYSTGIAAVWLSPFGALAVSFAAPFNDDDDDETESFQFNLGQSF